jgi:hypothetical protein
MLLKFMLISAIKTPLLLVPTLWDKVCLRHAAGQWFSRLTPPIKPDRHSITEILLKVVIPPCLSDVSFHCYRTNVKPNMVWMFIEWFPTNLALLIKDTQELQKFQRLSILYMGFNYLLFICFFLKGVGNYHF